MMNLRFEWSNSKPSCAIRLRTSKKCANLGFENKFGYNSAFSLILGFLNKFGYNSAFSLILKRSRRKLCRYELK